MKRMLLALSVLAVGMLLVSSCNKASVLGADLVEGSQANIKHTDSITFKTTTIEDDSILVFDPDPNIQFNNFFIGNFDDPVFGNTKANFNAQLWLSANAPNFEGAVLDSVILILRYDSISTYGDLITDPYRIGVYEIDENEIVDNNEFYYSSDTFAYDMNNPIAETNDFTPKYSSSDTIRVVDYTLSSEGDTITLPAHLRIPLSEEFGNALLNFDYTNEDFLEQFKGIVVKALNPTKGILSFNLISAVSNMTLFYRTEDTIRQQYRYIFSSSGVKFSNFKHDYTESTVEDFIDNKTDGDSLLFVQSMAGPYIKIEFPDPGKLGDIIVNKAELQFTFAELDNDDITYYPPLQSSIISFGNEGNLSLISDVFLGTANNINWFGGAVQESVDGQGDAIYTYSFNISSHFQEMVKGNEGNTIYIRAIPLLEAERARRSILFGPKHSKYPAKFILTYTVLNP